MKNKPNKAMETTPVNVTVPASKTRAIYLHVSSSTLGRIMKIPRSILVGLLVLTGCSSRSNEAYERLLELAGITTKPEMRRVKFIKTSGIDPYYLAKIKAPSAVSPADIFPTPEDWKSTSSRFITPPREVDWWRPADLVDASVWTPKASGSPSYTEVVTGQSQDGWVIYVAWQKTANF